MNLSQWNCIGYGLTSDQCNRKWNWSYEKLIARITHWKKWIIYNASFNIYIPISTLFWCNSLTIPVQVPLPFNDPHCPSGDILSLYVKFNISWIGIVSINFNYLPSRWTFLKFFLTCNSNQTSGNHPSNSYSAFLPSIGSNLVMYGFADNATVLNNMPWGKRIFYYLCKVNDIKTT